MEFLVKGIVEVRGGVLDICRGGIWVWDDDFGIIRFVFGRVNVNVYVCVGGGGTGWYFCFFVDRIIFRYFF